MPREEQVPGTIQRSPPKARRTWKKTHDHAVEEYGEGERAHRTAFAALKHGFEKVGDRWAPKKRAGPSDPRSTKSTRAKRAGEGETYGGVDLFGHTRKELYERARSLGVRAASRMKKKELARAIARKQ
jgi:ChaB protein/Rho termination factor-like protein